MLEQPPKPGLIVRSASPFNAETPLDRLRAAFVTSRADFYVRCHGPIPQLDGAAHRLRVDGQVSAPLELSLSALRARPARTVAAVMQCAGNRRGDLQAVRETTGDPWDAGAIGNAEWTGIPLAGVLRDAGADLEDDALHVAFEAVDETEAVPGGKAPHRYGCSIPMAKARQPEVLLAWAMNGEPLAPEHGYPLRLVVPGYAGVRSPKWLARVTVQDHPSDNPFQQDDYKILPPHMLPGCLDPAAGVTINDMPLNAAICEPRGGAVLPPGPTRVRGYAVATGRAVARVDVSGDGGRSWTQAELERREDAPWSWTFWDVLLDLQPGPAELAVRAWDSAGQTQPATPAEVWNAKGYLCAAWHRVPVSVEASAERS